MIQFQFHFEISKLVITNLYFISKFSAMRDLAVHTRKSPMQRAKELRKFINYMHGKTRTSGVNGAKSREFMEKWDLQIGEEEGDTEVFFI